MEELGRQTAEPLVPRLHCRVARQEGRQDLHDVAAGRGRGTALAGRGARERSKRRKGDQVRGRYGCNEMRLKVIIVAQQI